jgi:hypothetical protein
LRFICLALLALAAAAFGCHKGQVRLPLAPGAGDYIWRAPIRVAECRNYWTDLLFTAEPPIGYAAGRYRSANGFSLNCKLRWNDCVRDLGRLFEDLCVAHNRGTISLQTFERRQEALLRAAGELEARKEEIAAAIEEYRRVKKEVVGALAAEEGTAEARTRGPRARMAAIQERVDQLIQAAVDIVQEHAPEPTADGQPQPS